MSSRSCNLTSEVSGFSLVILLIAGCGPVSEDRSVKEHFVIAKAASQPPVGPPASQATEVQNVIRVGMTREQIAGIAGKRYERISRDKSVVHVERSLFFPFELWLYFNRGEFNESENDPLEAIIVRRTYIVWL